MAHLFLLDVASLAILIMDEIGQVFICKQVFTFDGDKDVINTAGFKLFPAEIERDLAAHDAVWARGRNASRGQYPHPAEGDER
jgi:acyl-CoA synthetase (AMP-forming)/AMP-acid ligase II